MSEEKKMPQEKKVTRRSFVKYVGAGAVVAAVAGTAAYYAGTQASPPASTVTVTQPATTVAATSVATQTMVVQYGGVLLYGGAADIGQAGIMDIQNCGSAAASTFYGHYNFFDTLTRADEALNIVPGLADSWEISSDAKTYTFHLHNGAFFWNGNEVTADHVKRSYERIIRDKVLMAVYISDFESAETPDKHTVVMHLSGSNVAFLPVGTAAFRMGIYDMDYFDKVGVDKFSTDPMGSGPFKFKEWIPDRYAEAVKNPSYWQPGVPYLDGYKNVPIPDPNVRATSLQTQDVDIARELPLSALASLEKNPALVFLRIPGNRPTTFHMHVTRKPFDKVEVRQAMAYAIDKAELVNLVLFGYGSEVTTMLQPGSYFDAKYWPYEHDPDKAKKMLTEAGYPNGFKAKCMIISYIDDNVKAGEIIKDQLLKVGVDLTLEVIDVTTFFDRWGKRDYDTLIVYWDGIIDPDGTLGEIYQSKSPHNVLEYNNPTVDELFVKGRAALDPKERQQVYFEMEKVIAGDVPNIPLYTPDQVEVTQKWVHGHRLHPMGYPRFYNVWLDAPHRR